MADLGDMDAILDQALDDLENTDTLLATDESSNDIANDSSTANVGNAGNDIQGNPSLTTSDNAEESSRETPGDDEPLDPKEFLKYLIEGGDEDLGEEDREAKLDEFMKSIQSKLQDEAESPSSSAKESSSKAEGAPGVDDDDDVAATLASILEQMTTIDDKEDPFNQEGDFPAGNFNPDDIVDGMMEQLLSKDLMYEPMKQVADRYPAWLEANTDNLPETDLERYRKQFKCFKELVHLYETDPSDMESLMKMMQDVQEFGQPPQDIINEIAPGLELDADGIPKLNPFEAMGAGGDGECTLM